MAMFGTGASAFSFSRLDKIQGGGPDNKVTKEDVKKGIKTAKGEEKVHLQKVLDGFGKAKTIDASKFGTLYG